MLLRDLLLDLAACYVAMSFIEALIHRWLMHRRRLPEFVYRWVPDLDTVFSRHAKLHHRVYYRQFNHEPDPEGRDVDISLDIGLGMALAMIPVSILWLFDCYLLGSVFVGVVLAHHLIWNRIHHEMHQPCGTWFSRTWAYRRLARNHWLHHKYPGHNFNIVCPLADFILGTHQRPSGQDQAEMAAIGL